MKGEARSIGSEATILVLVGGEGKASISKRRVENKLDIGVACWVIVLD